MLKGHLDPKGMAHEMERQRRVANALRAAELRAGATDGWLRARRPPDISAQVVRLLGWLRRLSPVRTPPIEPVETTPSSPVTGS